MKIISITIFALTMILIGCKSVVFTYSMPINVATFDSFPKEMQGIFVNPNGDSVIISGSHFRTINASEFSFNMYDSLTNPNVEMKKFGDYYILNIKDDSIWHVFPFTYIENEMTIYELDYTDETEKSFLKNLSEVVAYKEIKNDKGRTLFYLIDPSDLDLQKMLDKPFYKPSNTLRKISE